MGPLLDRSAGSRRLGSLDDERLAALVRKGDVAAFETLYDRHHASLLAFCRHMVGNREDGEDALQQTFVRAHRALRDGRLPDSVRPWLFAIARNRCRTLLAARRDAAIASDEIEPSYDGLAEDVQRRADLRELVADLAVLPEDQRGALVLFELGDLSHPEIAEVIGCPPEKVKALVFQARTALIAERDARATSCEDIRVQLESARAGALRRGPLRRHLRQCEPCNDYRAAVASQRTGLAAILPVAPTAGLKAAVLGAASSGTMAAGGGVVAVGGGLAVKALAAKVAVTAVVAGATVSGGVAAVDAVHSQREPVRVVAPVAEHVARAPVSAPRGQTPPTVGEAPAVTTARPPRRAVTVRHRSRARRRAFRHVLRHHRALRRAVRRHAVRPRVLRRLRRAAGVPPPRAVRQRVQRRRHRVRSHRQPAPRRRVHPHRRPHIRPGVIRNPRVRIHPHRRRTPPTPAPAAPPAPSPTPAPTPTPTPTPSPAPEPTPAPTSAPAPPPA